VAFSVSAFFRGRVPLDMETGSRAWLEEDVVCLARLVKSFGPRDLDTIMRRGGRAVAGRPVNDVRVMLEAIQKHYGFDASNRRSPAHAYEEERKAASTTPDSQQSGDERVNGRGNGTAGAHDSTRAHEEVIEISSGSSSVEEEEEEIEVSSGSEVVEVADSAEHFEPPREESGFETSTSEALGGSGNANSEANADADAGAEDESESSIDRRNSCEGEMRHTDSFHEVDKDEVKSSNSFQRADKEEWERRNEVIRRESLKARLERKRKKEQVLRLEQRVKHHRLEVNAAERELEEVCIGICFEKFVCPGLVRLTDCMCVCSFLPSVFLETAKSFAARDFAPDPVRDLRLDLLPNPREPPRHCGRCPARERCRRHEALPHLPPEVPPRQGD